MLTDYHENYVAQLEPPARLGKPAVKEVVKLSAPAYRQDPLLRQLENNNNIENVSFKPPKYQQNPLLRCNL